MLRLVAATLAGFLVFVLTIYFVKRADEPFFIILFGILSTFVLAPWLVLRVWPQADPLKRAARAGELELLEFNVARAWQIEEREDEGLHFVLELDSGGTLFLSGQFLYEPVAQGLFPCVELRLSLEARAQDVLALECGGKRIEIVETLDAFSVEALERGIYPGAFRVYAEPVREVLRAFGSVVEAH